MALWEYKVITSGKGGFATPQLLENFLNQLGKEEWEIVEFRSSPDNFLAFTGLARRGVQRDWTLEAAAAAAAKAEAEQRRADERAAAVAKEREAMAGGGSETPAAVEADSGARDESFRRPRDTELDQDPEALADEAGAVEVGDWDDLPQEEELPTLFEAVRPHLRRNQKGPGQSVAIDYLAKRWEQESDDIAGALLECGFTIPETEDSAPDYFEFEGDLYWLNKNNRGQLFLNVREKPRPAFRVTPVRKLDANDPAAAELAAEHQGEVDRRNDQKRQIEAREAERQAKAEAREAERQARAEAAKAARESGAATPPERSAGGPGSMPEGEALLAVLRPRMRQNRRGGGFSGSTAYLAKAMRHQEAELVAALASLGLKAPDQANAKPEPVEIGGLVYWVNKDGRGGLWINGREKREGEAAGQLQSPDGDAGEAPVAEAALDSNEAQAALDADGRAPAEQPEGEPESASSNEPLSADSAIAGTSRSEAGDRWLSDLRSHLKPNRRGSGASEEIEALARAANQSVIELLEALVRHGLNVPDDPKDKPVSVELGDEILWLNRSPKDDALWLNAKSKAAARRRGTGRGRKKPGAEDTDAVAEDSLEGDGPGDGETELSMEGAEPVEDGSAEAARPGEAVDPLERP
jgi:hypothetical protein